MIVRLAAIVLTLLLSAQVAAPGGRFRVCRYTGQRIESCACPETKSPEDARLLPQGCCELRKSQPADLSGVLPALDTRVPLVALAWPVLASWQLPVPLAEPGLPVRPGHDPPPRKRLFLSLRQLLI